MSDIDEQFIELMGQHHEEEGGPRIYGRLLGALLLSSQPRSLEEFAEQLRVSKGSISSNARLLESRGIAERVTVPGDRRDFYRISDDVMERMLLRQLERYRLLAQRLSVGREAAADKPRQVQGRFDELIGMLDGATRRLEAHFGSTVS